MLCWKTPESNRTIDTRKLLLDKEFIPSEFRFLTDVKGRNYIRELKDLKAAVDAVLKCVEDKNVELKMDKKSVRPPSDNLVSVKATIYNFFGEDPNEPPQNMTEKQKCDYRQRQIFKLTGNNFKRIFELQEKDLAKVSQIIEQNIHSEAVSAIDYLSGISTNLALTSVNPAEWCRKIQFETISECSKRLYETRQVLGINSKRKVIYLEPYLFLTLFNWPRKNTTPSVAPRVVIETLDQWKVEFSNKYERLNEEGKWCNMKESTLFFLQTEVVWSPFIQINTILPEP